MAFKNPTRRINKNNARVVLEKEHYPSVFYINYVVAGETLTHSHALHGVCLMFLYFFCNHLHVIFLLWLLFLFLLP